MATDYFEIQGIRLAISATDTAITAIRRTSGPSGSADPNEITERCRIQLKEYFAGQRRVFDLPLAPQGTPFRQAVWAALTEIPWGKVQTYRQIAETVGNPAACRAVGGAIGKNPLLIVIPCHRVLGKGGSLTGFSAGLDLKQLLLSQEGILP